MQVLQKSKEIELPRLDVPTIHGETEIVLKNIKTGLVERHYSENTFQGTVLADFLKDCGMFQNSAWNNDSFNANYSSSAPGNKYGEIWTNLVGGLYLFKDAITEGTRNMPAGNKMVGAGYSFFSNNWGIPEYGSFNQSESSATASAITQVYDFATDQANGQIGCVCLGARDGAQMGYGNQSGKVTPYNEYHDYSNSVMQSAKTGYSSPRFQYYGVIVGNNSYNFSYDDTTKIVTVRKTKVGNSKGSVFIGLGKTLTFDLNEIGMVGVSLATATDFNGCVYYVGNGKLRFNSTTSGTITVASGGTCGYYEYDTNDDSLTYHSFLNATGQSITWGGRYGYSKFLRGNVVLLSRGSESATTVSTTYYAFIVNASTGVVIKAFSPWSSYIADVATGVGFDVEYAHNLGTDENLICIQLNCTASSTAEGGSSKYTRLMFVYDVTNDTLYPTNRRNNGNNSPSAVRYICGISDDYTFIQADTSYSNFYYRYKDLMYLATINNLQSAVTKTAAQTMKVTYTLTEV